MSYETLTIILISLTVASLAAPIVGRFVAPWSPKLAESLIRLGADLQGARDALRLPDGTYPPSAEPIGKKSDDGGPGLAPLFPIVLAVGLGASSTACAGTQRIAELAEASRDVIAVAEPCLVAAQRVELRVCEGSPECEAKVRARWSPIASALDVVHEAWCSVSPSSEGCSP
jgi:hypothetical protein